MGDGLLGKCKDCTKKDTAERVGKIKHDPDWVQKERARCREKAKRLGCKPISYDEKKQAIDRYFEKFPDRKVAHRKLSNAIRGGRVLKKPCEICGEMDSQGHHEDYSRPLDVVWLCALHHALRHRQLRGEPGIDLSPVF